MVVAIASTPLSRGAGEVLGRANGSRGNSRFIWRDRRAYRVMPTKVGIHGFPLLYAARSWMVRLRAP